MDKPWFKLDPNNIRDPWWLYTSIRDTKTAARFKSDRDIICYFIFKDANREGTFYRFSTWYKDDPNRYISIKKNYDWTFDKYLHEMKEGDIVHEMDMKFIVNDCSFCLDFQKDSCKILERIEDYENDIYYI